jgi:hypothetical protein
MIATADIEGYAASMFKLRAHRDRRSAASLIRDPPMKLVPWDLSVQSPLCKIEDFDNALRRC